MSSNAPTNEKESSTSFTSQRHEDVTREESEQIENGASRNKDDSSKKAPKKKNDLVIRDGFPALYKKEDGEPLIDAPEPLPRQLFASYEGSFDIPESVRPLLHKDCLTTFTARTKDGDAPYSIGCTYFVPSVMTPRCALEELVLCIFRQHTKGLEGMFDPERSGAEWWTLVLDSNNDSSPTNNTISHTNDDNDSDNDDDEEDDDEVGMHFDADYGLEGQMRHMLLHPRVATVTYLSDVGVPTLVLNKRSPVPQDEEKKSLGGDIETGWLSGPKFGKHMCFDGRLLHGAPGAFFPGSKHAGVPHDEEVDDLEDTKPAAKKKQRLNDGTTSTIEGTTKIDADDSMSGKRVTLLVNVWLNHCPLDADLLEDEVCEQMLTPWKAEQEEEGAEKKGNGNLKRINDDTDKYVPPFTWTGPDLSTSSEGNKLPIVSLSACKEDPAGSEETVICHREVEISYSPKMEDCHAASQGLSSSNNGASSIELKFGPGALTLAVGSEVESDEEDE